MKTRIITAVVGLIVLAGVLFTFDTLVFNLVIAAITLIALHEIYSALGFEKQDWPLLAVLDPTHCSSCCRATASAGRW